MTDKETSEFWIKAHISTQWIAMLLVLTSSLASASQWPNCNFHCDAKEAGINAENIWLGDSNGNALGPDSPPGTPCFIYATFNNHAASPRYAVTLLTDLYVNGQLAFSAYSSSPAGICITPTMGPGIHILQISIPNVGLKFGDNIRFDRFVLSWDTGNTQCPAVDCGQRATKCSGSSGTVFTPPPPLSISINGPKEVCGSASSAHYSAVCSENSTYTYTYTWSIGGIVVGNGKELELAMRPPGFFNLRLVVAQVLDGRSITYGEYILSAQVIEVLANPIAFS